MSLAPAKQVNFPQAVPDSAGIPQGVLDQMLTAPFNDLEAVSSLLNEHNDVAAIIAEPLQRIIPAQPWFLEGTRALCDKHHVLLIFDEIDTGFRLAYGGAQDRNGVIPGICTLGKIIGGGMPVGAYAAAADIMDHVAPVGPVYQAGTLSGNPVAMAAGAGQIPRVLGRRLCPGIVHEQFGDEARLPDDAHVLLRLAHHLPPQHGHAVWQLRIWLHGGRLADDHRWPQLWLLRRRGQRFGSELHLR